MALECTTITLKQFMDILKRFDKNGNGQLEESELDSFMKAFEDEGLIEHSRAVEIMEKIREKQDESKVINMSTLTKELVPVNFLKAEFGEQRTRITSVSFMKLWDHYDADHSGFLDLIELKSFFYDLITKNSEEETSENPEDLEEKIDAYVEAMFRMFDIKDGKVSLEEMCKFCPVEENFLEQYEQFDDDELEEIFSHYDQDNSDEIEGFELEGFLKDLYQKKHKPGQSFDKFKAEKLKKFDKDRNKKFNKREVKNMLAKSA